MKILYKLEARSELALQRFYSVIYPHNSSSFLPSHHQEAPRGITAKDTHPGARGGQCEGAGLSQAQQSAAALAPVWDALYGLAI